MRTFVGGEKAPTNQYLFVIRIMASINFPPIPTTDGVKTLGLLTCRGSCSSFSSSGFVSWEGNPNLQTLLSPWGKAKGNKRCKPRLRPRDSNDNEAQRFDWVCNDGLTDRLSKQNPHTHTYFCCCCCCCFSFSRRSWSLFSFSRSLRSGWKDEPST